MPTAPTDLIKLRLVVDVALLIDGVFFIDSLLNELISTLRNSTYLSFLNFPYLVQYFFTKNDSLKFGAYKFRGICN
jgi:hypothetical protein